MKIRKAIFKITVLALAVFFAASGFAQAAAITACKGECCQNKRVGLESEHSYFHLSPHHSLEFEPFSSYCHPIHKYSDMASKTSQNQGCHDENLPPCCKVAQGNERIEGLASASMVRTDRPLDVGVAAVDAPSGLPDSPTQATAGRHFLPARAAPIPLFILNSTFLC